MSKRTDPERDLERLLDADAGEFGAIYRRLSRPEPPRRLDRVVIAHAARAVHGGRAPRSQRWLFGLGSAAGIVLAAGIAWQVGRQIDSQEPAGALESGPRSVVPVQPISEPARRQKSETAESDAGALAPQAEAAARVEETKPAARADLRKRALEAPAAAKPAPPPPPPAPAPAPATQPAPPESPALEAEAAESLAAPVEPQAFPASKELGPNEDAAAAAAGASRDQAVGSAAKTSGFAAAPEQSRAPSPNTSVKLRQNMHLPPEDWLAEILRLKREGHRQEAIENLRLFRRMHPDWALSDELRHLAQ